MGAGKTKIGRLVAQYFRCEFVDTDDIVEHRAGKRIADIFAQDGESVFRRMETEAITEALGGTAEVIALGGGAATRDENWALLKSSGALTIYLHASPQTILVRVADQRTRPLLAGLDRAGMLDEIKRMLNDREPWYRRAELMLSSDNSLDKYGMADTVIEHLKRAGIAVEKPPEVVTPPTGAET
jgi:shikimate kinase